MILSDHSIKDGIAQGRIAITPYDESLVQPASIDIRLDTRFRVFRNYKYSFIDPRMPQEELTELVSVDDTDEFYVHPGEFMLGNTVERVALGNDLVARVEGKSSLGRLGLIIHATAGYIDPGFEGRITLELSNVANLPIRLYPGMKIGQTGFILETRAAIRIQAVGPPGGEHPDDWIAELCLTGIFFLVAVLYLSRPAPKRWRKSARGKRESLRFRSPKRRNRDALRGTIGPNDT